MMEALVRAEEGESKRTHLGGREWMREEWAYYPGDKLVAAHMKWDFATCTAVWLLLMLQVQEEFRKVQSYFIERISERY